MSAIRRANPKSINWREKLSRIHSDNIINLSVSTVSEEPTFSEYHYSGQDILKGEFEYSYPRRNGGTREVPMSFYYRTESGLFVIHPGARDDLISEVVRKFRSALMDDVQILPGLSISKKGIWNFIQNSRYISITIEHDFNEYTLEDESDFEDLREQIGERIVGEQTVLDAELVMENEGTEISLRFAGDTISIPSDQSGGVPNPLAHPSLGDNAKFIIQRFEHDAIYRG